MKQTELSDRTVARIVFWVLLMGMLASLASCSNNKVKLKMKDNTVMTFNAGDESLDKGDTIMLSRGSHSYDGEYKLCEPCEVTHDTTILIEYKDTIRGYTDYKRAIVIKRI
jgi:hypothetical protein